MPIKKIQIGENIFAKNDEIADENKKLLRENRVFSVNIMGAPGSGKTAIIEKLIPELLSLDVRCGVIEGDIAGSYDSERIEKFGIPIVQINTGGACHLEAMMVKKGLENLPLKDLNLVIVENVGNLVCPAEVKIGIECNITVASITEGEEKPSKYPLMYSISDIVVLNKIDLLGAIDFDIDKFKNFVKSVSPDVDVIFASGKTGQNIRVVAENIVNRFKTV